MNTPIHNHPMIGETVTVFPRRPDMTHLPIDGATVARNGDSAVVRDVFGEWNGIEGLTMFYVSVPATGQRTHLSPREVGLAWVD